MSPMARFHPGVIGYSETLTALSAGAKVFAFGDSILAYNQYSVLSGKEFSNQSRGEMTWLSVLDTRFRFENWRDITRVYGPYVGTTGTLASNPFSTTSGSATVTVTHTSHGLLTGSSYVGGAEYVFSGATSVGGLTISGGYTIATVPTSSTFTIAASSSASSTATGGGSSVTYKQRLHSVGPQYLGKASNWATSADHTEGVLDLLESTNGFPSSGSFTLTDLSNSIAVVGIGTNDINSSYSAATVQANLTSIVSRLLTLGFARVVVMTVRPRAVPRTSTLPDNPFTTTSGSTTVVVSHPNQPYCDGQVVTFTGASAVGGITLSGGYTISSTNFSADSYQFTASSSATSSTTGGGTGVTVVNATSGVVYALNDARWTVRKTVNDWILTNPFGSNKVSVVDTDSAMLDSSIMVNTTTNITGAALDTYLIDGVHPSPLGSYKCARYALLPVLQDLVTAGTWYETDPSASGNYFVNSIFSGTAGAKGTGISGSFPDSWQLTRSTGTTVTASAASSVVSGSINKTTITATSASGTGVDSLLIATGSSMAWNNSGSGKSITVNITSSGSNPTVQITHSSLTNGAPTVGSQITFSNVVGGTVNGVDISGTWTVLTVSIPSSSTTYTFMATGQTATSTGSTTRTVDWAYSAQNLMPADSWIRFGAYVELSAWDKWRGLVFYVQPRANTTATFTYRAMRTYDNEMRYAPTEAWSGWLVSEAIKLDSEAVSTATNFQIRMQIDVENSGSGTTTGTIAISRPFLRSISDPASSWT